MLWRMRRLALGLPVKFCNKAAKEFAKMQRDCNGICLEADGCAGYICSKN